MSATEDGITDLMADYLRANSIDAITQVSIPTPGTRSQPDFQIDSEGMFVGEAKWEDKKWEGFSETRDYGQITGVEGSFLITYPLSLRKEGLQTSLDGNVAESVLSGHEYSCAFLRRDTPTDLVTLQLEEIPEWLASNIQRERTPEVDPDQVVSVLRQTAHSLNQELQSAPSENVFRNVLGALPDEQEEREAARETAGFLLVNQITFYRVLSAHRSFPRIDPDKLGTPADLSEYFELVLDYDYTPVFSFEIANDIPQQSLTILKDAVKSIYALSPERINHDVLGKVFHELIPVSARKKVAAYYTKSEAADIVAHLAIDEGDASVMDPACGSGTKLAAAYMRKRELTTPFGEDAHRRFVEEEITGIDVMPFAAHLSCIHLALQAPIYETDEVNIGIEDSTKLMPGSTISPLSFVLPDINQQRAINEFDGSEGPDIESEIVETGSIAMDAAIGKEMTLGHVDVVSMNPPYSRQESVARFGEDYKTRLRNRFSQRDEKGQIHGKMSYCSYFLLLADKFLETGGKIACVLPASLLNKTTDSGVREMLLEEYTIEHIIARTDKPNFSEDTDMREILLIAQKGAPENDASTAYTTLNGLSRINPEDLKASTTELAQGEISSSESRSNRYNNESYTTRRFPTRELEEHNLFAPFAVENHELFELWYQIRDREIFTRTDDLDAWLTGGLGFSSTVPTCREAVINNPSANLRQNDLWTLQEEELGSVTAEHRFLGEAVEIPRENIAPDFHRFSHRSQLDVSSLGEYAVVRDEFEASDRFFQIGEIEGTPSSWPDLAEKRLCHLGLMRRVDLTASGLRHLAYYSEEPRLYHGMMFCLPELRVQDARNLSIWFDSSLNLLQMLVSRIPSRGGWTEYHRNTVAKFYTPDPELFTEQDRTILEETFDDVHDVEFPSIVEQLIRNVPSSGLTAPEKASLEQAFPAAHDSIGDGFQARREIDRAILTVIGVPHERHERILGLLYPELLRELIGLKQMMA